MVARRWQVDTAPLAGEISGHVFFRDRCYGLDGGLYMGARLQKSAQFTAGDDVGKIDGPACRGPGRFRSGPFVEHHTGVSG
jgi:hypothetical protein